MTARKAKVKVVRAAAKSGKVVTRKKKEPYDYEPDVRAMQKAKAQAKSLYERAETINKRICANLGIGKVVPLKSGKVLETKDNFAESNQSWKAACVRRFEAVVRNKKRGEEI